MIYLKSFMETVENFWIFEKWQSFRLGTYVAHLLQEKD